MDIKALDALKAYGQANDALSPSGTSGAAPGGNSEFANLVTDALGDVRQASASFEATSAQSLTGQADIVDVVTAASNAEMMVQTVVTVRDKVIEAYKDIIKMPV